MNVMTEKEVAEVAGGYSPELSDTDIGGGVVVQLPGSKGTGPTK